MSAIVAKLKAFLSAMARTYGVSAPNPKPSASKRGVGKPNVGKPDVGKPASTERNAP